VRREFVGYPGAREILAVSEIKKNLNGKGRM
jgi:hypothetical protein